VTHGKQRETGVSPPSLPAVFWAFLRLGLTAFGGPAMVAYIGEMAVTRNEWLSRQSFREGVAVAQTIPGATAMQTAAYVGLRLRGMIGAAAAYIGFGLPAFLLMLSLSALYSVSHKSPISMSVFHGLQVIVVAIVAKAAFTFGRTTAKGLWDCIIALAAAGYLISGGNPVVAILAGAVVGLLAYKRTSPSGETAQHSDSSSLRSTTRQALVVVLIGATLLATLLLTNRRLFDLASLMLKVDILAFGGGFASVPVMLHSVAEVNHWMSTRTFMDGIAMGQVTPGPIVITATFVGYQVAGIFGAVVATVAVFFPSFVILVLIVPRFDRLKQNLRFQMAMRGILASFVGLLLSVTVRFAIAVPWSPISVMIGCAALIALMLDVGVPWVVLPGAVLSAFLLR
jgi:chromate transporter